MPKGVHDNHTKKGGRKRSCFCGKCRNCKHAAYMNRKRALALGKDVSDKELEKKMNEKFKKEGWD